MFGVVEHEQTPAPPSERVPQLSGDIAPVQIQRQGGGNLHTDRIRVGERT